MSRHLIVLILFIFVIASETLRADDKATEINAGSKAYLDLVGRADSACANGEWQQAASLLQRAMILEPANPGNILLLSNLGIARFNLGQDSLALEAFDSALDMAPSSVTILSNRARVYAALEHDQEAFDDYAHIMELDSTYISARLRHGLLALKHKIYSQAKEDIGYIAKHYPTSDEAFIGQATLLTSLGEYDKAIPYYNEILRIRPEAEYYAARAYCNLMTENLQEAASDISSAMELDPWDGELYLYRAALAKKHFRPDDARRDAQRAIELGVDQARAKEFL
ncbi:MAG: tetratricopeptide repeat protein [Duncaniella sp.]|nr:tetratricopeptide repeat protein [Duncaniella sp.]